MTVRRTRPRGFADWNPRPDTLALVAQVRAVLDEYAAHLPLTVRQVFYRLVGSRGYDKTERAYARLCETVGRARRAGMLPFAAFSDDGGSRHGGDGYDSPAAFLRGLRWQAEGFTLDRQQGQPLRLVKPRSRNRPAALPSACERPRRGSTGRRWPSAPPNCSGAGRLKNVSGCRRPSA